MPRAYKLKCTGCKQTFQAEIAATASSVTCSHCGKQIRIKRKQSSKGVAESEQPAPSAAPSAAPKIPTDEAYGDEAFGDEAYGDEAYGDEAYGDEAYGDEAYGDEAADFEFDDIEEDVSGDAYSNDASYRDPALPPKKKKRKRKKKGSGGAASDMPVPANVGASGRNLDDLTEGTFDKPQRFSAAGENVIRRLLFTGAVLIGGLLIIQFIRVQFAKEGVQIDIPQYGLVGVPEEPVVPKAVPTEAEILESLNRIISMSADRIRSPSKPQPDGQLTDDDRKERWKLAADPAPDADYVKIVELSKQWAVAPADFSHRWLRLREYGNDDVTSYVDVQTMRGKRLSGKRADVSPSAEDGKRLVHDVNLSPDGRFLTQKFSVRGEPERAKNSRNIIIPILTWFTLHKFDNTFVKAFPEVTRAEFVSNNRLMLSTLYSYSFFDIDEGRESEPVRYPPRISTRTLSPGRRYLVQAEIIVSEADSNTKKIPLAQRDGTLKLSVYETATEEKIAESEYPKFGGYPYGSFFRDGTRLVLCSDRYLIVVDMTTGAATLRKRLTPVWRIRPTAMGFLGDGRMLRLTSQLLDSSDAAPEAVRLELTSNGEKMALDDGEWLAGRYWRPGPASPFSELPIAALEQAVDNLPGSGPAPATVSSINLVVEGTSEPFVLECLRQIVERKTGLTVTDEPVEEAMTANIQYSDRKADGPFSLDRWKSRAPKNKTESPVKEWRADQHQWEANLQMSIVSPDGQRLFAQTCSGSELPVTVDFQIPTEPQFRIPAVFAAVRNVEIDLTPPKAPAVAEIPAPDGWMKVAEPGGADPFEIAFDSVPVNNEWPDDLPEKFPVDR